MRLTPCCCWVAVAAVTALDRQGSGSSALVRLLLVSAWQLVLSSSHLALRPDCHPCRFLWAVWQSDSGAAVTEQKDRQLQRLWLRGVCVRGGGGHSSRGDGRVHDVCPEAVLPQPETERGPPAPLQRYERWFCTLAAHLAAVPARVSGGRSHLALHATLYRHALVWEDCHLSGPQHAFHRRPSMCMVVALPAVC